MIELYRLYGRVIGIALLVGSLVWLGWKVNGWRLSSANAELLATQNAGLAAIAEQRAKDIEAARAKESTAAQALAAAVELAHQKEIEHAQAQAALQSAVADGSRRLYIASARCQPVANVPGDAATSQRSDGKLAELDPAARPAYFSLRDTISRKERQIELLQAYAKQCEAMR